MKYKWSNQWKEMYKGDKIQPTRGEMFTAEEIIKECFGHSGNPYSYLEMKGGLER